MADPQKIGRTTEVHPTFTVAARYKTPRPYSATPVATFRSNVPGEPTKGTNGNNRPPLCTGNQYRVPAKDFDERTVRQVHRNSKPKPSPGSPFGGGRI